MIVGRPADGDRGRLERPCRSSRASSRSDPPAPELALWPTIQMRPSASGLGEDRAIVADSAEPLDAYELARW